MRSVIHVLTLGLVALAATCAAQDVVPSGPGDYTRSITVDGLQRRYLVHIPATYDPARPIPVVIAFHGGGVDAGHMVAFSGLNEKSEEAGFVAVYPYGTGRLRKVLTFNAGDCCGYAAQRGVDDVEFTRRILDDLGDLVNVDARRVYATGMSNGAMMAYRLASELSDRIAAIAPVAGTMGTRPVMATRPVSVMHFHGTADESLPFRGGRGKGFSDTDFYPVEQTIRDWVEVDGCGQEPNIETIPDRAQDGTSIVRKTYGGCKGGTEVVLVIINGGGHTWPGREPRANFLGKSTANISANDMMWEFFVKHSMP